MSGRYGNNEWKIKAFYILSTLLILAAIAGVAVGAYVVIRPKFVAYQEAKALQEEEERKRQEQLEKEDLARQAEETKKAEEEANKAEEEAKKVTATPTTEARSTDSQSETANSDYIMADSNNRYLSNSDVQSLSLQQINYAKNEIYARRGRKFKSKELQNYFNSKSWYNGTIDPDDFSESMFNKYEKENAKFLSEVEYSRSSNGYQLDK